jgi:hypothetical protein
VVFVIIKARRAVGKCVFTGKKKKEHLILFPPMATAWQKLSNTFIRETAKVAADDAATYSTDLIQRLNAFKPRSETSVPPNWHEKLQCMINEVTKRSQGRKVPCIFFANLLVTDMLGLSPRGKKMPKMKVSMRNLR